MLTPSVSNRSRVTGSQPSERALTAFWQDPTPERARAHLRALLPVLRMLRTTERKGSRVLPSPPLAEAVQVGPYVLDEILGSGGDGQVFRAHRQDDQRVVALKLNARGDALLADHLASEDTAWPAQLLSAYETGEWGALSWVARELADETLAFVRRPFDVDQVRDIFRVACEGVAWLHAHHVYAWDGHTRNVFRVGEQWKLGDFGRVWICVPPKLIDHALAQHRFGHWSYAGTGVLPYDPEREHRLKLDDCAMLACLLVDLLTGKRWEWYFRALNTQPYCSAVYPLTDERDRDEQLSLIVNRCWRGDAGGAPVLANGDRGEQSTYTDPLELLRDVSRVTG